MKAIITTKKRGNSVGFIIPELIVRKLKIKEGDKLILTIEKK